MINKISNMQLTQSRNKTVQNKPQASFGMSIKIDNKRIKLTTPKSFFKIIKTFYQTKKEINAVTKEVEITIAQPNKSNIYLLALPKKINETKYNLAMSDFDNENATAEYMKEINLKDLTPKILYEKAMEAYKGAKSRFFL